MRNQSEKKVETALRELIKTVGRNIEDINQILVEFEVMHTEEERIKSKMYNALSEGYFALCLAKEKINYQISDIMIDSILQSEQSLTAHHRRNDGRRESVSDLSSLSQEKQAEAYNLMKKGFKNG